MISRLTIHDSRTPKFRAWDGKRMREVFKIIWGNTPSVYFTGTEAGKEPGHLEMTDERLRLMEGSGLESKSKKEIFEGDIIRFSLPNLEETAEIEYTEEVYFAQGCFCTEADIPLYSNNEMCEIVGNIYENPELLK